MTHHELNEYINALDDMIEEAKQSVYADPDVWLKTHEDDQELRMERIEECENILFNLREHLARRKV